MLVKNQVPVKGNVRQESGELQESENSSQESGDARDASQELGNASQELGNASQESGCFCDCTRNELSILYMLYFNLNVLDHGFEDLPGEETQGREIRCHQSDYNAGDLHDLTHAAGVFGPSFLSIWARFLYFPTSPNP
ncbi:hypothetical protein AVEN_249445-1 [Araneus ventricosus]|uniref:Uncharacterized protein n=1 Tax=Araneus ventricosus TaxID=182803 RepID=A0A4Y2QRF9_ARAVE|nr:hypothetical protein AVEN_249445-1 [Araneus ventricosus]